MDVDVGGFNYVPLFKCITRKRRKTETLFEFITRKRRKTETRCIEIHLIYLRLIESYPMEI